MCGQGAAGMWLFILSWPSRAWKKNSAGIFEYFLASMLKVYVDVF